MPIFERRDSRRWEELLPFFQQLNKLGKHIIHDSFCPVAKDYIRVILC